MKHHLRALAIALALAAAAMPLAGAARAPAATIRALSDAVAARAAATRPQHWPLRHACLYYALAGQALLARHGIPARLRVGRVVYRPGTPTAHPIDPHVWLETGNHLVDYAMLPRRGEVAIVPIGLVATHPSQAVPGVTQVLAIAADHNESLALYLRHHYRRFRALARLAQTQPLGRPAPPRPLPASGLWR
jgi:hypothetical protein